MAWDNGGLKNRIVVFWRKAEFIISQITLIHSWRVDARVAASPAPSNTTLSNICLWFQLKTMPCWVRTLSQCQVLANTNSGISLSAWPKPQNVELVDTNLTVTSAFETRPWHLDERFNSEMPTVQIQKSGGCQTLTSQHSQRQTWNLKGFPSEQTSSWRFFFYKYKHHIQ